MERLIIQKKAYQKLRAYIENCEDEISGLGKVEITERGFLITDIKILKQTVTGTTTDLDNDAMGKFSFDLIKNGEDIKKWTLWWHSHADMDAFFSGTDTDTIQNNKNMPYIVSLVSNHKGDSKARLDVFEPFHTSAPLIVELEDLIDNKLIESCKKEITQLVTKGVVALGYQSTGDYRQSYEEDTISEDFMKQALNRLTKKERKRYKFLEEKEYLTVLTQEEVNEMYTMEEKMTRGTEYMPEIREAMEDIDDSSRLFPLERD